MKLIQIVFETNTATSEVRIIVQPYSALNTFCCVMFLIWKKQMTQISTHGHVFLRFINCSSPSFQATFLNPLTLSSCSLCEQRPPIPYRSCSAFSVDLDLTRAWTVCQQTSPAERPSLTSWPADGPPTQMNGPPFSVSVSPIFDLSPAFCNPSELVCFMLSQSNRVTCSCGLLVIVNVEPQFSHWSLLVTLSCHDKILCYRQVEMLSHYKYIFSFTNPAEVTGNEEMTVNR